MDISKIKLLVIGVIITKKTKKELMKAVEDSLCFIDKNCDDEAEDLVTA